MSKIHTPIYSFPVLLITLLKLSQVCYIVSISEILKEKRGQHLAALSQACRFMSVQASLPFFLNNKPPLGLKKNLLLWRERQRRKTTNLPMKIHKLFVPLTLVEDSLLLPTDLQVSMVIPNRTHLLILPLLTSTFKWCLSDLCHSQG